MRIGIDARFIGPQGTGLGKYTQKLVENLAKIDTKNHYVIFLKAENFDFLKLPQNFQKIIINIPWYSIKEQVLLPKILERQKLDILHVPHFNAPLLYSGKLIITIHDLIHHQFSQTSATTKNWPLFKFKRLAYKFIINRATQKAVKIITPSNSVKDEILKNFKVDPSKIIITHEAAEEEYFPDKRLELKTEKAKSLLYVGNAYPHKNLNKLLDAMKILSKARTLPTLTIVCPRDVFSKRLKEEIKKRELESIVEVKGYMDTTDLIKLFQKDSAYVFPSLAEGFGIPGLNAMAANLPVIASNIPTLKEVYGSAALYFDPNDPKDIAEKITKITKYIKLRQNLIEKGQNQVKKYSWQKMAKQTLEVYANAS